MRHVPLAVTLLSIVVGAGVGGLTAALALARAGLSVTVVEQAKDLGWHGVSSKTCKGLYKSLLNGARCAAWNAQAPGAGPYFQSAEDLTLQPGLALQQDLALVNLLGITHVERNGHHYVDGMRGRPAAEQEAFAQAHPDLYEQATAPDGQRITRVRIVDGRLAIGSLASGSGFASAAMPDFGAMAPMQGPSQCIDAA